MRAFSLVELSIVLVILGLLTGGVLAGQSLIRAAEVRSVGTDANKYVLAVMAFRDRYMSLPGDMNNATKFWGALNADASTCVTIANSGGTATCDGNGNGIICNINGDICPELHQFWLHMANAGLIEGRFTGRAIYAPYATSGGSYAGLNAPIMRMSLVTMQVRNFGAYTASDNWFAGNYGHIFFLGKSTNPLGSEPFGAIFSGPEAWGFDGKYDDGRPASGNIRANPKGAPASWLSEIKDCTTSNTPTTAEYDTTNNSAICAFMYTWLQ